MSGTQLLKAMRFPAATGNTAVDTGYRTIAAYLSGADAHAITDLAVDYVRACIGHGVDAYSLSRHSTASHFSSLSMKWGAYRRGLFSSSSLSTASLMVGIEAPASWAVRPRMRS